MEKNNQMICVDSCPSYISLSDKQGICSTGLRDPFYVKNNKACKIPRVRLRKERKQTPLEETIALGR